VTTLSWDGCVNVRDLGGLRTADGRTTQLRRVVRADNVRRLSAAGRRALVEYGVRRIVDLRFPEELAEDPVAPAPVEVVHVSLLGERRTAEWQARENEHLDSAADAADYLVGAYARFLDVNRARFATAIGAVAAAPDGAVLVHCMGGKDRTGLVSALVLRVAGVPVETVAADYALTESALSPSSRAWIAAAPDEDERRRRLLLQPSPAAAMSDVLARLEERYGGARAYLRGGGLGEEALDALEERLVAP
jgi:protein tyrosine/serine phosphatase